MSEGALYMHWRVHRQQLLFKVVLAEACRLSV